MVILIIASQNIVCLFMNSLVAKNLQMPLNVVSEKQKKQEMKSYHQIVATRYLLKNTNK
jgi:hypothetical protein